MFRCGPSLLFSVESKRASFMFSRAGVWLDRGGTIGSNVSRFTPRAAYALGASDCQIAVYPRISSPVSICGRSRWTVSRNTTVSSGAGSRWPTGLRSRVMYRQVISCIAESNFGPVLTLTNIPHTGCGSIRPAIRRLARRFQWSNGGSAGHSCRSLSQGQHARTDDHDHVDGHDQKAIVHKA